MTGQKLDLPWGQEHTLLFLDWLITDRQVSAATASSYLAGIKKLHEIRGLDEPKLRQSLINQVLKGKSNLEAIDKRNSVDKGRLPATLTVMKILKQALNESDLTGGDKVLTWAVCTLAFHGSFRINEILCQKESMFDPNFTLMGEDVKMREHIWGDGTRCRMLQVAVKHPKENKKGNTVIVDVYETFGPTCPVRAFCKFLNAVPTMAGKVLFRSPTGIPLTGRKLNRLLRKLLSPHIDFKKGQITCHSFRSGVPSLLGSLGHDTADIKSVGRWSSRAFELYTKLPKTCRAAVALKLGKI